MSPSENDGEVQAGQPIRALVVDYGGVLTVPLRAAFDGWLAAEGIDRAAFDELFREWHGADDDPVARLETGHLSADEFSELLATRLRRLDGDAVVPKGLLDRMFALLVLDHDSLVMLRAARAAGLKTALLSNSWDNEYPWADLGPLLDVRVVSGDVGLRKPDAAIYELTAGELGLPVSACVFVDDLPWNVEAAKALGMAAVLHTDLATTLAELARLAPALAPYLPPQQSVHEGD